VLEALRKVDMKLHEWKKKDEEMWVRPRPCHICKKVIKGAYGHTLIGEEYEWSCSTECEKEMQHAKVLRDAPAEAGGTEH